MLPLMQLSDWAACTAHGCPGDEPVEVDVTPSGDHLFISFWCPACEYGSLEDDFRWWVRCPECDPTPTHPVDHVSGEALPSGEIQFECEDCGLSYCAYPPTKWDG